MGAGSNVAGVQPRKLGRLLVSPPGRDASIDTLRGLACLLVVLYHVRGGTSQDGLRLPAGNPWSYLVDSLVYLRMPLFSFLSGFVYAARPLRGAWSAFARSKARRLLVPMVVIGTGFALLRSAAGGLANGTGAQPWYLWHIHPVAHFWFLEAILWVFLLVALADRLRLLDRAAVVLPLIGALLVLDQLVPTSTDVLALRNGLYLAPFFLSGAAARRFDWRSMSARWHVSAVALAVLLTTWSQLGLLGIVDRVPERHVVVAGLLGVSACASLLLVRRSWRPLAVVGAFSFTIYTCHVFGTSAARIALERFGVSSTSVHVVVGVAAGVSAGIVVQSLAARSPWLSALLLGSRWPARVRAGLRSQPAA